MTPARVAALIVGLVAGAAVGWAARPASPAPEAGTPDAAPHARAVLAPRAACADESALVAEIVSLADRLEALDVGLAVARAQTEAEIGPPMTWPPDTDPAFTEAGVEAALQDMLEEVGAGTLVGLDCGEYPCVGIVVFASDALFKDKTAFSELVQASSWGGSFRKSETMWTDDETGRPIGLAATLAFPDGDIEGEPERVRVGFRMDDAMKTFAADVQEIIGAD